MRNPDGTWPQGVSGNKAGHPKAENDRLIQVRNMASRRSPYAIRRLRELMDSEDGKVAIAACVATLKVGGAFSDDAAIERKVVERLQQLIEEAQQQAPRQLAAVG